MGAREAITVVAAIIRQGDDLLLVRQQGPDDPSSTWALPGGRAEPGELLSEALVREVREETGLTVEDLGEVAYVVHQRDALFDVLAVIFNVRVANGTIVHNDPDDLILKARFVPVSEGLRLLSELPWRPMREPLLAVLRGEALPGAVWCYRDDALVADGRRETPTRPDEGSGVTPRRGRSSAAT